MYHVQYYQLSYFYAAWSAVDVTQVPSGVHGSCMAVVLLVKTEGKGTFDCVALVVHCHL